MATNSLRFKMKVEANEGIWVEEISRGIETCPNCKFIYSTTDMWTTWNNQIQTPIVLTSSDYSENYEDVITNLGKDYFLGVVLNNNNQITNAYTCGIKNGNPFCNEGTADGSAYTTNQTILQEQNLWNNICSIVRLPEVFGGDNYTECGEFDGTVLSVD